MERRLANRLPAIAWLYLGLMVAVSGCSSVAPATPRPFTSDGCSSAPDGTLSDRELWLQPCAIHDYRYWRGGTPAQRGEADRELARNIAATGHPVMAQVYWLGVRIGGSPWWPTPWRWGYAWDWPRGYRGLSESEQQALDGLQPGPPEAEG